MSFIPSSSLLAIVVILSSFIVGYVVYDVFFNPLSKIPRAHWSVSIPYVGDWWILFQRYMERSNDMIILAHENHGPVVRLGYNELSVNCVDDGIRTIYGGAWEKHEFYPNLFVAYGVNNMFAEVKNGPHSQKKRIMSNIYSKSYLQSSPQLKSNTHQLLTTRYLPILQQVSEAGFPFNAHEMNNAFTMDFITAYQFGIDNSSNLTQDVELRKKIMGGFHSRYPYIFLMSELPWLEKLTRKLGFPILPSFVIEVTLMLEAWGSTMCDASQGYLDSGEKNIGNEPLVYKQFATGIRSLLSKEASADAKGHIDTKAWEEKIRNELHSEMLDHFFAGFETSGTCLSFIYWQMSKNPELQERLNQELVNLQPKITWPLPRGQKPADVSLPDSRDIDALPFLHAIVMEVLRLHAPIPGPEPRMSPHTPGGNKLGKYTGIPGGVRVSAMSGVLHRNPDVYPEPEVFNPDRWLTSDQEHLKEMHRWFWVFGSGGRMCIGSNLAMMEIKLITVAIYTNWKTQIIDDNGGLKMEDGYNGRIKGGALMLTFTHR